MRIPWSILTEDFIDQYIERVERWHDTADRAIAETLSQVLAISDQDIETLKSTDDILARGFFLMSKIIEIDRILE